MNIKNFNQYRMFKVGFTLIELILVIVIISIIASVSIPALGSFIQMMAFSSNIQKLQECKSKVKGYLISGNSINNINNENVLDLECTLTSVISEFKSCSNNTVYTIQEASAINTNTFLQTLPSKDILLNLTKSDLTLNLSFFEIAEFSRKCVTEVIEDEIIENGGANLNKSCSSWKSQASCENKGCIWDGECK